MLLASGTMSIRRTLAAAAALGVCTLAAPARAQDAAAAKALFERGVGEMTAGHYVTACPALEQSYKLDPRPGTLFTLAECEAKGGRLATAITRYDDYLALYGRLTEEQLRKQGDRDKVALRQKAALGARVPALTLSLPPGAPPGTVVRRDGAELAVTALGVAFPVDPGEHVLTTQAPGGALAEVRVTLAEGEKKQVILPVKDASSAQASAPLASPSPAPGAEAPAADHGPGPRRTAVYVTGGVGVAGLVVGAVTGALTLGNKSVITQHCNVGGIPTACDATGFSAASQAKTEGLVSSVAFGVGIAGVVAGAVLLLTEPKRPVTGASGVQLGVLSAGREGGTAGVRGAW
jgi:hypothetical protein